MSGVPRRLVNEPPIVADASAIIALLAGERIDRFDPERLTGAAVSAVNFSEVLARLHEMGLPESEADIAVTRLNLNIVAFDAAQAHSAAQLKPITRPAGLSLGDRACLALALTLDHPVVTADRAWANVDIGIEVVLIR
jgi:ribonuclease VapC